MSEGILDLGPRLGIKELIPLRSNLGPYPTSGIVPKTPSPTIPTLPKASKGVMSS